MSYIISIIRTGKGTAPLAQSDLETLVGNDKSLEYDSTTQVLFWAGHPSGDKIEFCLEGGHLESMSTPDDETMEKMQQIAKALGAVLEGEDGARSEMVFSWRKIDPLVLVLGGIFMFAFAIVFIMQFFKWLFK